MYSQHFFVSSSGTSNPSTLSWFSSNERGKLKEGEGGGRKDQISMQQVLDDYELQYYSATVQNSNNTNNNLDSDAVSKKRRKTKFDIAPESVNVSSNTKSHKWITTEELISLDNNLGFYLSTNQSSTVNDHLPLNYIPAEDEAFRQRIKKALQKNFEYIEKLDRLALEQKLYGFTTLTSSTTTTPANTNIRNKFQDKFNKAKIPDKKGIGIAADLPIEKTPVVMKAETNRVYVSNLPKDITEEEIEILFSPQGKIKKIKLYTDKDGKKKGDCLITFVSPDSASSSLKLNKLNIGDGHIISVTKAEFQPKDQQPSAPKSLEEMLQEMTQQLQSSSSSSSQQSPLSLLLQTLPDKSVAENNPIVFLWNAYDLDAEDLAEIETDLLLQACTFGDVKAIQMYEFPQKTLDKICRQNAEEDNDDGLIKKEESSVMLGGVVIVFEEVNSALTCCNFLSGQYFSDRKLFSFAYSPDHLKPPPPQLDALQTEHKDRNNRNDEIALLQDNNDTDDIVYDDAIRKEVEDVEDFLNSLM